jgi:DNA repair protein RadC
LSAGIVSLMPSDSGNQKEGNTMIKINWNAAQVKEPTAKYITTPDRVRAECCDMSTLAQESMHILTLNARNKMIDRHMITLGLADSSLIHPREIFRAAITDGASTIVLVHNHPSGDPSPSAEDLRVTRQMIEAGRIIGIHVTDHVIIGRSETAFVSLREKGLANFAA